MLDKQYNRVIRWIRRAQTMSADGKFSDAILDVECARAELDDARQELLLCHQGGKARCYVHTYVMILPTALAAVLFLASPLRVTGSEAPAVLSSQMQIADANGPQGEFAAPQLLKTEAGRYHECLTADGRKILDSVQNSASLVQAGKSLQTAEEKLLRDAGISVAEVKPAASGLSDADIYRLVEVGRKALYKNNNPIVLEFN